jgi:carboxylate-amine ligase
MIPYIPLFVALSTSSPFWNSKESGLKGYRLAAYDELPRTGLPEAFGSQEQHDEYVSALKISGVIPDESYIWWAIRSSSRHPTLELRAPDVCTSVEDAIALASLYRALARRLCERPALLQPLSIVDRAIAVENKWRAQRYGTDCIFATKDGPVNIGSMLSAVIEEISEDASILGCATEVDNCKIILERGSSADRQLRAYQEAGGSISAVTKWIASTTVPDHVRPEMPPWHRAVI